MKLPTMEVRIETDDGPESISLRSANLTADPMLRSMTQKAISILFAYHDVLSELIKMSAPVMARGIENEQRMGRAHVE